METLQRIFLDKHDRFIADQMHWSEFVEEDHKKYEADTYFKVNSDEPMGDPQRGQAGQQAYWDFVKGLKSIQQLEPLDDTKTGAAVKAKAGEDGKLLKDANKQRGRKALWERIISDRAAAESTYRFQERIKFRAANFNNSGSSADDPMKKPGLLRPPIRTATMQYFMTPPEADFSLAAGGTQAGLFLLYAYTIFNQVRGIMTAEDAPLIYNQFVKMSSTDVLWLVFLTKEVFLLSVPLLYIVLYSTVAVLGVALSPFLAGYYFGMVKGKPKAEKAFSALIGAIKAAIGAQALLLGSLFLNLSTAFRMALLADQLFRRKANASIKDFGLVMTTVSNIVFDLVLVMMMADDKSGKSDPSKQILSMCINLVNLMRVITGQHLVLHNLCDAFKDINEHRLTKFEFACLLVKIQEQLLEDDIQYNFVEHLYSGPQVPLAPQIEPLQHKVEDKTAIENLMPDLPEDLAKDFGHDGRGEFDPAIYTGTLTKAANYDAQMAYFKKTT
mmetsp:Transcript_66619/g.108099  ORF Transcript_66619/g.108099 Transcript_66619/m.108099 type:complete len:499 (+) Transcript_66619:91-1587(+)|eukprot:CAMPEP_0179425652 /NCGR_PEP_ID=MMETSP0799-20121207/12293_1 /TAXON_ID=46947 /ORGANISM="Geminigera cryophila, Strain CCMP2564" /LENGTH=498 /DNA_ID=CAMNT_0021200299 /DNA_START=91 /DNA_END=1587 /DNA_ORIENTATION=-